MGTIKIRISDRQAVMLAKGGHMIFYFSGTGNSLHIAKGIGKAQNDKVVSIADEVGKPGNKYEYAFKKGELLGFVFPVYAWGPPRIVLDFIRTMNIRGESPYVFSVCTCGGEEGNTTHLLQKALTRKELVLDCAFTVKMPNNYILSYDVDPPNEEKDLLEIAERKMIEINNILADRRTSVFDLIAGKAAALKTALVNPLFNHFALSTSRFYATDSCTRCKLCERICPIRTISVADKPSWGKACTQCLACINRCPEHAIQYGKSTINKGRYVHPDLR